jgi:hypothetical protein
MKAQNAVKSTYRRVKRAAIELGQPVPPLKKWARGQALGEGKLAAVCRQWLYNKGEAVTA